MSHIRQAYREASEGRRTLAGADSITASMVSTLERTLPAAVKAACDSVLGPEASIHDRWTMYATAQSHCERQAAAENVLAEVFDEQRSQPREQRR